MPALAHVLGHFHEAQELQTTETATGLRLPKYCIVHVVQHAIGAWLNDSQESHRITPVTIGVEPTC